ncbi:MAG TPA: hypothetical protein VFO10_21490 [Oligoflexus sp.]|uniref:hypothetical protein n=1 Tax=Oligoflexus sp. TaxID=1971216 RepID=UPI002D80F9C6|nr:hypothetical protein [Oligoflexus sp.]HET9239849.1 hypothetical protein [Oligoflexus sp.]
MKRHLAALLVLLGVSCKSEIVTHQRLFTPGDKGAMTFKIPSGGLNLIIQPTLLPDADSRAKAQAYPYAFEYVTLGADQQPIARQRVQGLVHCDRVHEGGQQRTLRCPGSRVLIDLKSGPKAPQYLTIRRDSQAKARDLFFAVTMRAPQSEYRARLHGLRLSPHEKSALLDTAYAGQEEDVKQLAALSTLAPMGQAEQDYRDQVIYQDGAAATPTPRFPSYAVIGPEARIVVPVYQRDGLVRVRALPLGDRNDYTVCWQPMAEPLDGRCYKTAHSASPDTSFPFPRGRLIFSAPQPLALDVEYSLTEQQKFHLADAVQQYSAYRLPSGQTLSVNLDPFQTQEFLPLRLHVWAVHGQKGEQQPAVLELKIVMPDGTLRQRERLTLDMRRSPFDRSASEAEVLSRLNTFHVAAGHGGGRLLIQASPSILVNMTLGRASTPLYSELQAHGMIRADQEREFWIPITPEESVPQDMVASYAWNPDVGLVAAQRVFFPTRDLSPGSFAFTPTRLEEMTWEGRKRSAHYVQLQPGLGIEAFLERGPILPMMLVAAPGSHAALRVNGHTLWEGRLDRSTQMGQLDASRFAPGSRLQLVAEGAEIFVGGIRLAQSMSTVYAKRFYYSQNRGSFLIQKTSPQQTVSIELLLTEAPTATAQVQVNVETRSGAVPPSLSREFTHRQRVYTIMPRTLVADSVLADGRKAELVTFPLPLRSDLPSGEYQVNVTTSGMKGAFLAVSSQLPNFGIRLTSASDRAPMNEAPE